MPSLQRRGPTVVLSIAGYDPSSGAGVTADIKTIAAHGCYAITCITALTVQSTQGVKRFETMDASVITETLEELAADFSIAAVRIGMLGSAEAARAVAAFIRRQRSPNVVLDPVLKSSSGTDLISRDGAQVLKEKLLTLAHVITPNLDEAAALTGLPVSNLDEMQAAALQLRRFGAQNVIITGGHLNPPIDLLSLAETPEIKLFKGKKISSQSTHGTGCAFATSLACNLALGRNLIHATRAAKLYVTAALRRAVHLGKGTGPINHLAAFGSRGLIS
ncbi:MAG TPA: bifunctional hydroxymethylpyrimidine kinase/phosphomethylpyrimidine kinase [Candidatus Angelobacter sp.]|nr:bifunctional hydroxymethylpyrimidine kinase/phosphomethylpyrimidine kinase [Candidatus Angelobacter sp.]